MVLKLQKREKERVEYTKVHEALAHTVSNIRMSKVLPSVVAAPQTRSPKPRGNILKKQPHLPFLLL